MAEVNGDVKVNGDVNGHAEELENGTEQITENVQEEQTEKDVPSELLFYPPN